MGGDCSHSRRWWYGAAAAGWACRCGPRSLSLRGEARSSQNFEVVFKSMASHPFEISTDRGQTAVERSLAEIRAGRPVLVQAQGEAVLVASAESLEPELCQRLAPVACGRPRLVLAAARLRRLGVERTQAGVICCPVIDHGRIAQLALKLDARIDAPVAPAGGPRRRCPRADAARPRAAGGPRRAGRCAGRSTPSILRVESEAVRAYRRAKARDLKIVSRAPVPLEGAPKTEFVVFRGGEGLRDQVAIIVGKPGSRRAGRPCGCIRPASPAISSAA